MYGCYNLYRKIAIYEDWLAFFGREITTVYIKMIAIDRKEIFSKDDDVGFAFKSILTLIEEFEKRARLTADDRPDKSNGE